MAMATRLSVIMRFSASQPAASTRRSAMRRSNTANGSWALLLNQTGHDNTATGYQALYFNIGSSNTANGVNALYSNRGSFNTANGREALYGSGPSVLSTGSNNTANGYRALYSYTTGQDNVANGVNALYSNTTGSFNTATGRGALNKNTTASNNTADGYQALNNNTGGDNTASGYQALLKNTTGSNNVAVGAAALENNTVGSSNIAIGGSALFFATGSGNIAIGLNAGIGVFSGANNIEIGTNGGNDSGTIRIGTSGSQTNTYLAGISGVTVAGGVGVIVDSSGHLGTVVSSERYKDAIKPMDKASEAILALKPVTFHYKKELDPEGIPQFGLVAEEVEKVNPALVARDADGKVYTVRYDAVNAMLLNEFLKEHRTVQEQKATIAQLKQDFAEQRKQIEALTAGLQKVSAQVEMSRPAAQIVDNDQ